MKNGREEREKRELRKDRRKGKMIQVRLLRCKC